MSDSNILLELKISYIDNEGVEMILSWLSKLRSLTLERIKVNLDFKLIFTQMKALRSLSLRFDDN